MFDIFLIKIVQFASVSRLIDRFETRNARGFSLHCCIINCIHIWAFREDAPSDFEEKGGDKRGFSVN